MNLVDRKWMPGLHCNPEISLCLIRTFDPDFALKRREYDANFRMKFKSSAVEGEAYDEVKLSTYPIFIINA